MINIFICVKREMNPTAAIPTATHTHTHTHIHTHTRLRRPWDFPGKNTGVGCHFLLQRTFPTQGLNLGLLHCRQMLYHLNHQGSPYTHTHTHTHPHTHTYTHIYIHTPLEIQLLEHVQVGNGKPWLLSTSLRQSSRV